MILPFSTKFPNGKPTYFIDKIWDSICEIGLDLAWTRSDYLDMYRRKFNDHWDSIENIRPKEHTIRKDEKNRWKAGVKIHFTVFNRSKNSFRFAPVIECKSVQKIEIIYMKMTVPKGITRPFVKIDNKLIYDIVGNGHEKMEQIAINDGFESVDDFFNWFNTDFTGKIIHWTDLKY
jgi:hypothetical protein